MKAHCLSGLIAAALVAALCACSGESRFLSDGHGSATPGDAPFEPQGDPIELYIHVEEDDLVLLYERDVESDDRVPAAVRVGEGEYSAMRADSLRFRGNTSRRVAKKSFNLRTDEAVPASTPTDST